MEQTFTVQFTVAEGNALLNALSHFPYKESAPLIEKIRAFAATQIIPTQPSDITEEPEELDTAEDTND